MSYVIFILIFLGILLLPLFMYILGLKFGAGVLRTLKQNLKLKTEDYNGEKKN